MSTTTPVRPSAPASNAQVGSSLPRSDARAKIRGEAEFVGDMRVPNMLHAKVLRSPIAHGTISDIDTSAAEQLPGVIAVLTGADLGDIDPYYGHAIKDRPVLAIDRVRFVGEPVAAVAALDEATAAAAVDLIDVDYEPLPVLASLPTALAPDAAPIHQGLQREGLFHGLGTLPEREGNTCYRYRIERGSTDEVFAEADVVVQGEYIFPAVYQYAMETHSVIASYDHNGVELWANCQHPFLVRAEIAALFDLPAQSVRIHVPYLGGGFGSKSYTKMEPITVALARKADRPVKLVNRVDESMVTTRRHGMRARMRTASTAEGRLLARQVQLSLDTGAYADNGPRVTATAGDAAPGPYGWDAVAVDAACVYTNTGPSGSYRAFGATHLQWIGESQVDEVARRTGLDPLEIRRRNLLKPGEEVRPGGKPLDADLIGDVEKVAAAIGWDDPKDEYTGRGVSVGLLAAGAHPVSTAAVRMEAAGEVSAHISSTEMGQGTRQVMAQITGEVLGLQAADVRVKGADTSHSPYDRSTGASRSTTVAGLALQRAAEDLLDQLRETAATHWQTDPAGIQVGDGGLRHGDEHLPYPELIIKRFGFVGGELVGRGEVRPEGTGSYAEGPVFWEVCIAGVEATVDPGTGEVRIVRSASIADVGRAINPQLIERQDEGGTMQGLGNALFEQMIFFEDGMLGNDTLLEYRVPTTEDVPATMACVIVENGDGPGPFGAKGCGEGVLAAIPAAMTNALADAGVYINELPATPERVWRAMHAAKPTDQTIKESP